MTVVERIGGRESASRAMVRCLGRFRLEDALGDPFQLRTRKARALLAALALHGRPVSREMLADLLWSDRETAQARSSLRQAIFEIQHIVNGDAPMLAVGREDIAIQPGIVATDIELIRLAVRDGGWTRLQGLLERSEPGLFTDLDGADLEFDTWLRIERGQEPSRTFDLVVEAAARCRTQAGARAALDLVAEILRLDPGNEDAARLALSLDHELGDNRALHRRFETLRERLRSDYGAEPSAETVALYRKLSEDAGVRQSRAPRPPKRSLAGAAPRPGARRSAVAAGALMTVPVAMLALAVSADSPAPAPAAGPIILAVLPFEHQSGAESWLADGLWDDTRAALSRNANLRVLGRPTIEESTASHLSPGDYARRFGVAYVLNGRVRRSADQLVVSVSLTRTADGIAIWEDSLRGRLGDPLALQGAIARGIEGKLRGRLAPGGGRRAEQIATSPEVYALYSEARAMIHEREQNQMQQAKASLRRAVALDPNFAPAWSSLALAIYFSGPGPLYQQRDRSEALAAVRKSLAIAPNLAQAHATLASVELGNSAVGERELRRAVALDPSYAEAWNWLGNNLHANYRYREAIAAFEQAIEVDPLWLPPVPNLVWAANEAGDRAAVDRLFRRLDEAGASRETIATARAEDLLGRGDYSGSARALLALGRDARGHPVPAAIPGLRDLCMLLGEPEAAARLTGFPSWAGPLVRGERLPPSRLDGRPITPAEFWSTIFFTPHAVRAMVNLGKGPELVRLYRAAFGDADAFISGDRSGESFVYLGPSLAVALRSGGFAGEADYILASAAIKSEAALRTAPGGRQPAADLAVIRAAQGDHEQALRLLSGALARGWLPDNQRHPLDLALEPAFRELRGDPRFAALRKRVLDHVARERAELGPLPA